MKHKGLSWDGGKKRVVAAFVLAAVMVLPGVAQAKPTSTDTTITDTSDTKTITTTSARGVSWG